jgi:hypothetical protein
MSKLRVASLLHICAEKLKWMSLVFAVFTKSLCHIMEVMQGPLTQLLESRLEQNNAKIAELEKRQAEIQKLIDSS